MKSMHNNSWPLSGETRQLPDTGPIVAGRNALRIFAFLLVSIFGLALSIWQSRSVYREPDPTQPPDPSIVEMLNNVQLPKADLAELATRLGGRGLINTAFPALAPTTFDLGARQFFWVSNMHGNRFQVRTTFRLATAHSRMWVQDDLDMDLEQLEMLSSLFEEEIYPTVVLLLGDEPLSNNLPLEFVFTDRLGPRLAGYFSPQDRLHLKISETSNGRRMVLINIDLALDGDQLTRLVAHELQHLLHWELDSNETAWMQEGFSAYAEQLLGPYRDPRSSAYLSEPDLQLNTWPLEGDPALHYGATSLLINYLDNRFGSEFISALARHPDDGLESLDSLIHDSELWDSTRNKLLTTEDIVLDWGLANYLQLETDPHSYPYRRDVPSTPALEFIGRCKENSSEHSVSQYGFDYIRVRCDEAGVLAFSGKPSTKILPTTAHSGQYFVWSNRGDLIDTRLTRQFDFTNVPGPLTLQFWTWYELQKGSDFVYLLASEDGQRWSFLETTSGSALGDMAGAQFGFGYSGINRRHEWSRQTVDLSQFAGKRVRLRFEYVTDTARMGEGFLIDDLSIIETNYRADFEDGLDGWDSEGFVRTNNTIPQQFRVALVRLSEPAVVEHLTLDDSSRARVSLASGEEIVLVVMGATRHTRQPASYMLGFTQ